MSNFDNPYVSFSFLDESKRFISEKYELSNKDFIKGETTHSVDITNVKKAAVDRVIDSINLKKPYRRDPIGQYTEEERILSYPIARVLVAIVDNPFLYYLFSVNEARRFVNLSTQIESEVSLDRDIDVIEVNQGILLDRLGYKLEGDDISINLIQSVIPEEYMDNTELLGNISMISTTVDKGSEWLDPMLLWAITSEINEGLDRDVPEFLENELESEAIIVDQNIPEEFRVSKRGLVEEISYKNIPQLVDYFPPVLRESAHLLRSNELMSSEKRSTILRTLLDLGVEVEDIVDWLGFESEWTHSYGRDILFDLQGDIQHKDYGFTSYKSTNLLQNGVLDTMGSIYSLIEYSPVYTVLNKNGQLHPGKNIRPPEMQQY